MKASFAYAAPFLFLILALSPAIPAGAATVSVAIIPFLSSGGTATALEKTATAIVRGRLEREPAFRLVPADRTEAVAAELGLMAGASFGDSQARHFGTLADADIVIIGRTEATGKDLTLTARIIGVQSLRSDEILLEGSRVGQIAPLVSSFSEGLAVRLAEQGDFLAASSPEEFIVAEQRASLAGRNLPTVFLSVTEEYEGNRRPESAAEALLAGMLRAAGFELAAAVRNADVILFAVARGHLQEKVRSAVISAAELEIRAVDTLQGRLLYHEAFTHSAVDPFASTAGSKAFREGVLLVAANLLSSLAPSSPPPTVPVP